ncbi:hypothetical protein [Succinimonas amylolytica]|uniref:hypothetical protein n=1 Tax=Succinimonas amylolytica TaxID=83769 RepID=UPI000A05B91B|nr:hypothetical protein [Succinimonas amylolytica]
MGGAFQEFTAHIAADLELPFVVSYRYRLVFIALEVAVQIGTDLGIDKIAINNLAGKFNCIFSFSITFVGVMVAMTSTSKPVIVIAATKDARVVILKA